MLINFYQISVGKRADLRKCWKLATEKEIENGVGLVKIKDREGFWIEQNDMLSKYLRRPSELELMSASQFAKIYTTSTTRIKHDEVFRKIAYIFWIIHCRTYVSSYL